MSRNTVEDFFDGGSQSFKFDRIGKSITGTVVSQDTAQMTEYKKDGNGPLMWKDDAKTKPQNQLIVELQTSIRDDNEDDGLRTVYIPSTQWRLIKAVGAAVKSVGRRSLETGGLLTITYTGDGERDGNNTPPKEWSAAYQAPGQAGDPIAESVASQPEAVAQQAAPAAATPAAATPAAVDPAALAALGIDPAVLAAIQAMQAK